jgi:hypothetical protein
VKGEINGAPAILDLAAWIADDVLFPAAMATDRADRLRPDRRRPRGAPLSTPRPTRPALPRCPPHGLTRRSSPPGQPPRWPRRAAAASWPASIPSGWRARPPFLLVFGSRLAIKDRLAARQPL